MTHQGRFDFEMNDPAILAAATNAVIAASDVPDGGLVIYSEKLGYSRHFFYWLQIRLYPSGNYGLVWQHSCGNCRAEDALYQFLEDAALALIECKRNYYQADADDRADAAEAYYESMRLEV